MASWLITWGMVGHDGKVKYEPAAILNGRLSGKNVRKIVELLFANERCTLRERIAYAKNNKNTLFAAQFEKVLGVSWEARIYCGSNPFLYARLVDNLRVIVNENGEEELTWKEQDQRPKLLKNIRKMGLNNHSSPSLT